MAGQSISNVWDFFVLSLENNNKHCSHNNLAVTKRKRKKEETDKQMKRDEVVCANTAGMEIRCCSQSTKTNKYLHKRAKHNSY